MTAQITISLLFGLLLVVAAVGMAIWLSRRKKEAIRRLFEDQLDFKALNEGGFARTRWFGTQVSGRSFAAGLVNQSDRSEGRRSSGLWMCVSTPLADVVAIPNLTDKGADSGFDDRFKVEDQLPVSRELATELIELTSLVKRVHLWSRSKTAWFMPSDVFPDLDRALVGLIPERSGPDQVQALMARMSASADRIEALFK